MMDQIFDNFRLKKPKRINFTFSRSLHPDATFPRSIPSTQLRETVERLVKMKPPVILCLCFFATRTVFGLQCLTTDMLKLREGQLKDSVADCDDSFQGIFALYKMAGKQTTKQAMEKMFNCYTLTVQGDRRVTLNGCMLKGGCELLRGVFKELRSECRECDGNICNSMAASPTP